MSYSAPPDQVQQTPQSQRPPSNALGITALILGIIAFLSGLVPVWGIIVGIAAIVIGAIALRKGQSKPFSLIGIIGGAIAVIASLIATIVLIAGLGAAGIAIEEAAQEPIVGASQEIEAPAEEAATPPNEDEAPPADNASQTTIVYEVESDGATASVTYMTADGGNISQQQDTEATLPWSSTLDLEKAGAFDYQSFTLTAMADGDATTVTCRITVDGEVVSENTSNGAYSIAMCSTSTLD